MPRLALAWLPACHLWAAFSFPFHIASRAYDLASFGLFSNKLKLNFHLNTCPPLWSLTRANIGSTHKHTHTLMSEKLQTVPNSFLTRPTNDQKFISFGFLCSLQRDCKSKQLEGQLVFYDGKKLGLLLWSACEFYGLQKEQAIVKLAQITVNMHMQSSKMQPRGHCETGPKRSQRRS